jgi:hypothetical protein
MKTRVRDTSETFMVDVEIQYQRHRSLIREVVSQLDVPTLLTPVSNLLLWNCCVFTLCVVWKRSVIWSTIELELFPTTNRGRLIRNNRGLDTHGRDKECLSETRRPVFISTMRSDLPQGTHRFAVQNRFGGILPLFGSQTYMLNVTRSRKHKFEVPEGLPVTEYQMLFIMNR